jgi:hypothetical protein
MQSVSSEVLSAMVPSTTVAQVRKEEVINLVAKSAGRTAAYEWLSAATRGQLR